MDYTERQNLKALVNIPKDDLKKCSYKELKKLRHGLLEKYISFNRYLDGVVELKLDKPKRLTPLRFDMIHWEDLEKYKDDIEEFNKVITSDFLDWQEQSTTTFVLEQGEMAYYHENNKLIIYVNFTGDNTAIVEYDMINSSTFFNELASLNKEFKNKYLNYYRSEDDYNLLDNIIKFKSTLYGLICEKAEYIPLYEYKDYDSVKVCLDCNLIQEYHTHNDSFDDMLYEEDSLYNEQFLLDEIFFFNEAIPEFALVKLGNKWYRYNKKDIKFNIEININIDSNSLEVKDILKVDAIMF